MDLDTNNNKTDFLLPVCPDGVLKLNPSFGIAVSQSQTDESVKCQMLYFVNQESVPLTNQPDSTSEISISHIMTEIAPVLVQYIPTQGNNNEN